MNKLQKNGQHTKAQDGQKDSANKKVDILDLEIGTMINEIIIPHTDELFIYLGQSKKKPGCAHFYFVSLAEYGDLSLDMCNCSLNNEFHNRKWLIL